MVLTIDMSPLTDALDGISASDTQSLAVLSEMRDLQVFTNGLMMFMAGLLVVSLFAVAWSGRR